MLINGEVKVKGIWRNAILIEELIQKSVAYNSTVSSNNSRIITSSLKKYILKLGGMNDSEDEAEVEAKSFFAKGDEEFIRVKKDNPPSRLSNNTDTIES